MSPNVFTVVDLFAGVGGLSLGFEQAGATVIAAVETNEHHARSYKNAHRSHTLMITDSVENLGASDIYGSTNLQRGELDLLIGGPPCQPFSTAGKRNGTSDDRGTLVWQFVRLLKELSPRAFVMENVIGLKSIHGGELFSKLLAKLQNMSYNCSYFILDAADFGVPQRRRRLFIVGTRLQGVLIQSPEQTHVNTLKMDLLSSQMQPHVTVKDAIWDLPGSQYNKMTSYQDDSTALQYRGEPENEYQKRMRGNKVAVTGNGITIHFPHILENISKPVLPEGATEPSTRYRRLYWDRPAFTLRAGSGSFTALRPIHPSQSRVITVREAARLQSFPDYVEFSPVKKWAYQQIGNSVPPLLGRALGAHIMKTLRRARAR